MKIKRNFVVIVMLLVIGLVFGLSLELKNFKLEQLDAKYEEEWKQTVNNQEEDDIKDNNIPNDDNHQKGLFEDFYSLMSYANKVLQNSKSLQADARGTLDATTTKEKLKSAGVPREALLLMPGNSITLKDQVKFTTLKDKRGNKYSGLGFYGKLPEFAEGKIDVPNRLSVAHYFDGMQYYVGTSDDKRVEQNCDPYVDTFTPMSYEEYVQSFKNDLGDIFYLLTDYTVSDDSIKRFKKPVSPLDTYEVQLNFTKEDLVKVTANVSIQHQHMLGMSSNSQYQSLSLNLTFDYQGQLVKMAVKESFDTAYRFEVLGLVFIIPISVEFDWTQTFKYTYKNLINMPTFK